jgi:uncharacterized protein
VRYASDGTGQLAIEVVHALPGQQELIALTVAPGTTVGEAIRQSAIGDRFLGEDLEKCQAGIWGKPVQRDHLVQHGDRIELYRPLRMDPREARRKLAAVGGSMGQADPREDVTDPD